MFKRLFLRIDDRFNLSYDKWAYENILDDPNNRVWRFFNHAIIFLIISSVLVLVIQSVGNLWSVYRNELFLIDFFISSVFLMEYIYRFSRSKKKISFIKSPLNIVDLMAFLPFFISLLFSSFIRADVLKVLRIMRVFRILKLAKHLPVIVWFIRALKEYKNEYRWIIILFVIVLTIVSVFIFHAENKMNPEMFSSIPKSFWWAIVTMATVWYWDIYPITIMWRIIWSLLIFLWPVLLALVSAVTILVFMDVVEMQRWRPNRFARKTCRRCKTKSIRQANYCIKCWKEYKKKIK